MVDYLVADGIRVENYRSLSLRLRDLLEPLGLQAEVETDYQAMTDTYEVTVLAEDHRWPPLLDALALLVDLFRERPYKHSSLEIHLLSCAHASDPESSEEVLLNHVWRSSRMEELVRANPTAKLYAMTNPAAWEGIL